MVDHEPKRLLYLSYLITQIGSWAFRIGLLVELLRSSIGAVGIGVAVIFAPIILGSLFLSPIVDRVNRLNAMLIINALRILALCPLLFLSDVDSFKTYMAIAVLSILQPVYMSAQVSFLRGASASSEMVSVLRNITYIDWGTYVIGMSAGAFLVSKISMNFVLLFNIAALIFSVGIIWFIRSKLYQRPWEGTKPKPGTISDLKPLYPSFLAVFLLNLGAGIINIYPAVRTTIGGLTDHAALTTIVIANGIFGLLGALSVKPIYDRLGPLSTMAGAALLISASLAAMAVEHSLALAVASSSFMLGLGQIFAVSAQTHMVGSVPKNRAGQISGLFQCCTFGGVAANGVLFSFFGTEFSFNAVVFMCAGSAFAALCVAGLASLNDQAKGASTV